MKTDITHGIDVVAELLAGMGEVGRRQGAAEDGVERDPVLLSAATDHRNSLARSPLRGKAPNRVVFGPTIAVQ